MSKDPGAVLATRAKGASGRARGCPGRLVTLPRLPSLDRQILVAPDMVARAAAAAVRDPRQRWMLRQPRAVRRSYAQEVHGRPDEDRRAEAWMLLQSDAVRRSYVRDVLGA